MSGIRINSNILSQILQRHLAEESRRLSTSLERLSSGLRINHAADDSAGLALSSALQNQAKRDRQALRNITDGISLLSVGEGALRELEAISTRQKELAVQAANGVWSVQQRRALQRELDALVEEYNRIVDTTEFNDIQLFREGGENVSLLIGDASQDVFSLQLGKFLGRPVGDGTFQNIQTLATVSGSAYDVLHVDLDRDGIRDLLISDYGLDTVSILHGNGNGTFSARASIPAGDGPYEVALVDVSGDGNEDIVMTNLNGDNIGVLLANGDGTFKAAMSFAGGDHNVETLIYDANNDGKIDIITSSDTARTLNVFLGNGDGTFLSQITYGHLANAPSLTAADLNGDGQQDIVATGSTFIEVRFGNTNGTFKAGISFATPINPSGLRLADINRDGFLDLVTSNKTSNNFGLLLGNADGTFTQARSFAVGLRPYAPPVVDDINGDGFFDLISGDTDSDDINVLIGNGNGTFRASASFATGDGPVSLAFTDIDNDGVNDLVVGHYQTNMLGLMKQNTARTAKIANLSILTRADALSSMATIDQNMQRIEQELGEIGSMQSRLSFAKAIAAQQAEAEEAAASRILDVDVAAEVAELVRHQITQQAAVALLAQANQVPALALLLLGTGRKN